LEKLEAPIDSLPFLELYHKSALNVEKLSKTIKKASWGLGVFAAIFFAFALVTLMAHTAA
jgi:hypothetical protein